MVSVCRIEVNGERAGAQAFDSLVHRALVRSEGFSTEATRVVFVKYLQLLPMFANRAENIEIEIVCDGVHFRNGLFVIAPVCRTLSGICAFSICAQVQRQRARRWVTARDARVECGVNRCCPTAA